MINRASNQDLTCETVLPWEEPDWDRYVFEHPAGTVYHTSTWCSIVLDLGRYQPLCMIVRRNGRACGLMPLALIKSKLTGSRIVGLPFSDVCYPLADDDEAARALLESARDFVAKHGVRYVEIRGIPRLSTQDDTAEAAWEAGGFVTNNHFKNYVTPLTTDTDAVRKSFNRTAVRQTINKSIRLGAVARRAEPAKDLDSFYELYARNRKHHGIPPQPKRLFELIFERMDTKPSAKLYVVEHERRPVAALVTFDFRGVTYAKYEGVDERARKVLPIYALFWKAIEDAALAGGTQFDFGRTAADNKGLNGFKSRWGTACVDIPYLFHPPGEGLSVVKSDSLKYRIFTGVFKRMPLAATIRVGARIFRHFG